MILNGRNGLHVDPIWTDLPKFTVLCAVLKKPQLD